MNKLEELQKKKTANFQFLNDIISANRLNIEETQNIISPRQAPSISSSNMTDQIIRMYNQRSKETLRSPGTQDKYLSNQLSQETLRTDQDKGEAVLSEIDQVMARLQKKYQQQTHDLQTKTIEEEESQSKINDETMDDILANIKSKIKFNPSIISNESVQFINNNKPFIIKDHIYVQEEIIVKEKEKVPTPKRIKEFISDRIKPVRDDQSKTIERTVEIRRSIETQKPQDENKTIEQQKALEILKPPIITRQIKENMQQLQKVYKESNIKAKDIDQVILSDKHQVKSPEKFDELKSSQKPQFIKSDEKSQGIEETVSKLYSPMPFESITPNKLDVFPEANFTFQTPIRAINFEAYSNLSYSQSQLSREVTTPRKLPIEQLLKEDHIYQELCREEKELQKELQSLLKK